MTWLGEALLSRDWLGIARQGFHGNASALPGKLYDAWFGMVGHGIVGRGKAAQGFHGKEHSLPGIL